MIGNISLGKAQRLLDRLRSRLASEWALTNRTRSLVLTAGVLIWLALIFGLQEKIDVERSRQDRARADIARLTSLVSDTSWRSRLAETQDLRSRLESRFWPAPTPGLAEASFEAWLRERFQQHGIEIQQVLMARAPIESSGTSDNGSGPAVERMTAKVISTFRAPGLINIAADVAEKDKLVTIDRLTIRTGRNARIEMDVSAYLQK